MHAAVISLAAVLLAASASGAEARARFKFKTSPSAPAAAPATPAKPAATRSSGGGVVPAVLVGGAVGARATRSREDLSTSSTTPAPLGTLPSPVPAAAPKAAPKPAFVCANERTVGRGAGFCDLH